jgi:hypothetical protein
MATAFIVRPFGIKRGIDFDRVEQDLIDPALASYEIVGRTTADVLKQGNIRTEMFTQLLTADVVIVDISISNANVFYELGIRHALRNKRTFMIRGSSAALPPDEVPFDLKTDRYLTYQNDNPAAALVRLTEALRQTLLSPDKDSPVFELLPALKEQDKSRFLVVPKGFQEEVVCAAEQEKMRYRLGDLKLLQTEAMGFRWQTEGLRLVGRAQVNEKAYEDACATWEAIRQEDLEDKEANKWLGTIYQKLGQLTKSSLALQRVLESMTITQTERAEAHALRASNLKTQWQDEWQNLPPEQQQEAALRSPLLARAYEEYLSGFREDLNHYYSGINALGLLTTRLALAAAMPGVWADFFADDHEESQYTRQLTTDLAKLRGSVTLSLEAERARLARLGTENPWLAITAADLACLTIERPKYVVQCYQNALAGTSAFAKNAVRKQLLIYEQLGVVRANVSAALLVVPEVQPDNEPTAQLRHTLLFTGHQIDNSTREEPRFPADGENIARLAIKDAITKEVARVGGQVIGLAGGANGGDILFHEVCAELGIETFLYLAMPHDDFVRESVEAAGPDWVDRFNLLYKRLPRHELGATTKLPPWLQLKPKYGIWQRNNLWMLYNALAFGSQNATLIALWDGEPTGNGPGGTQDMVAQARASGSKTLVLPTKQLFGLT